MELIDKAAVLAEIERRIKTNKECMLGLRNLDYYQGKVDALNDTISFLDTLEVKEVDFEKVWEEYFKYRGDVATVNVKHLAKHFFELGLKSKSFYVGIPNIDDTLKEMGIDPDSKEANSFKNSYYKALDKFKEKKGEDV